MMPKAKKAAKKLKPAAAEKEPTAQL